MKKETIFHSLSAALIAGGMLLATPALAVGYCSTGTANEGITAGDVTFEGTSANDCYGVVAGNLTGNNGAATLNAMNWGGDWTYLDATDAQSATFMGLDFTISATNGTTGSWTLTGIDTNGTAPLNLPASFDFAIGLKAANEYALWGFDNVMVDGTTNGSFSIVFTNKGGNHPDLSHMIVFGRDSGGGSIAAIPEAKTYAMMLAGLGLVGFASRRRMG